MLTSQGIREMGMQVKEVVYILVKRSQEGGDVHHHTQRKNKEVWREKGGTEENNKSGTGSQLYADAVKRSTQGQWSGPSVTTKV